MAQTLKEYLDEKLKANSLRAPDRNPLVAPQADLAKKVKALLNQYETKKLGKIDSPWNKYGAGHSIGDLLFGQSPELLDDISYGLNPLTSGGRTGRIPIPDKRLLDMPVPIPSTGGMGVIKKEGQNWLTGSVENALKGLKRQQDYPFDKEPFPTGSAEAGVNSWIDGPLTKYIKNRMATPSDEVRKLADQGILHYDPGTQNPYDQSFIRGKRELAGVDPNSFATTEIGKAFEDIADLHISAKPSENYPGSYDYSFGKYVTDELGWRHLIDELLNSTNPESKFPQHLRMKPEGFKGLTMEEAVKKVHGINAFRAEQAKKVNERFAQAEGIPVYKDYGDGTRLLEYRLPDSTRKPDLDEYGMESVDSIADGVNSEEAARKQLESWLKQEGDTMGHCVGGYCDAVTSGQSRILSLRDKKGKSRATIELRPSKSVLEEAQDGFELMDLLGLPQKYAEEYYINLGNHSGNKYDMLDHIAGYYPDVYSQIKAKLDQPKTVSISQIKGPGNRAPDPDVLSYLQDFVKSGNWSDVSDLDMVGLYKKSDLTPEEQLLVDSDYLTLDEISKLRVGKD